MKDTFHYMALVYGSRCERTQVLKRMNVDHP
jgi:hypothetical protein